MTAKERTVAHFLYSSRVIISEQVLDVLDQIPQLEFERFAAQVLALRLRRNPTVLSANASELLLKLNQGLLTALEQRYQELIAKPDAASLTPEEYTELLHLTDQVEQRAAERVEHLAALATLRQQTVPQVMQDLGMTPPTDDERVRSG